MLSCDTMFERIIEDWYTQLSATSATTTKNIAAKLVEQLASDFPNIVYTLPTRINLMPTDSKALTDRQLLAYIVCWNITENFILVSVR